MSAMDKMLTDMVMKAIPQEIRDQLTQENLTRITTKIQEAYVYIKDIGADTNERVKDIQERLERLENDNGNRGGNGTKRVRADRPGRSVSRTGGSD